MWHKDHKNKTLKLKDPGTAILHYSKYTWGFFCFLFFLLHNLTKKKVALAFPPITEPAAEDIPAAPEPRHLLSI